MIISEKQQQANRGNAKRSTGPKTPEGKAAVQFNALTYGLRARALFLPTEDFDEYNQHWAAFEAEWQPQTPTERFYLETMASSHWLLARADASEQRIRSTSLGLDHEGALLERVDARRARLERSFTAAMHELRQLQKERQARPQPQPPQTEQTAKPVSTPAPKPGPPQAPPPDYVMSEGAETHPVFAAPATSDTR
jgi:hypothetical protein